MAEEWEAASCREHDLREDLECASHLGFQSFSPPTRKPVLVL